MAEEGRAESAETSNEQTEPRWGMLMPLLTAGFCPAKTARRTDHLGVGDAILLHVVAFLLHFGLLLSLLAWADALSGGQVLSVSDVLAGMLISLAFLDFGYLLTALFLAPWGARRERLGASIGRSFHRALRHTPHIMQALLLANLIAMPLFQANSDWLERQWEEVEALCDTLVEEGMSFDAAWEQAWDTVGERASFYEVHGEKLGSAMNVAGGLWFIWGLLSAIGTAPARTEAYPPICESCGYNLTSLPMEGRCPECGDPIANSLGSGARAGTPWQQRSAFNRWDGFWKTSGAAFARPGALGRRLIPSPDGPNHHSLAWIWCGGAFIIAWLGCLFCYFLDATSAHALGDSEFFWFFCPAVSYLLAMLTLILCPAGAFIAGLLSSWKHRHNMLPAAMQAACAAGGVLLVWLAVSFVGWAIAITAGSQIAYNARGSLFPGLALTLICAGPTLICLPLYLWLIARIARGARFSNR